jgi:hypothetical protein
MKNFLSILLLTFSLAVYGQQVIWQNDFSNSADWTIGTNGQGTFIIGNSFHPEMADVTQYMGTLTNTGTTASNGFAFFNGVQYLLAGSVSPQDTWVTSDTIDLSLFAFSYITLSFNQRFRHFNFDSTSVEISEDGGQTWVSYPLNQGIVPNDPAIQNTVLMLIPVNQSALTRIRFRWKNESADSQFGSGYGWIIDDVKLFNCNGAPAINQTLNISECQSYTSQSGQIYSQSGTYTEVIPNNIGCDSIYLTINLNILNSITSFSSTICNGNSYNWNGQIYSQAGQYMQTLTNQFGCDSLVTMNLFVTYMDSSFSVSICNGDTYTWNGQQYTQAGQYTQTFINQFGCDSVVTLTLNVNTNDNISITPNPAFGNAPLNVAFANQTPNLSNYNFTWYFGDGTSQQSNAPFLSHIYTQDGYADVTVVGDNLTTGCSSSQTFNDMIFVIGGVTCTHTATVNQSGPLTGCVGDSILLSSNTDASFSYQWNRNGIPVGGATSSSFYPTQSGSYTVTIYQNNCPVTSAGISVTMNALPSVPNITSSGTIVPCSGGSMTLTAPSGFTNYLWNTGSTASSLVVSQSGNYSVSVTNSNGCQNTSNPFTVNASFMAAPQVCIVGVDSLTNENRVVWEKPLTQGIDSFYVYKETNVSNVYSKIGATDYNDLAVFLDVNSNPAVQAYRYKISSLDTCGVETNVGDFHKTIHLTINAGVGGAWNLIWSHYEGLNFGSYNIYRGTDPSNISLLTTIQSNLNSYTDLTPPTGPLYYQIEVVNPVNCDPTKIVNYGVSRSNIINNGVSGVKEIVNTNILVYPNPTNGNITLEVSSELVGKRYSILDFSGRIILDGKISSTQEHIDLQNVARGAYYLSIENSSSVTKLIRQ